MDLRSRPFRLALASGVFALIAASAAVLGFARQTKPTTIRPTLAADTAHVTISVAGMYCESCEATVHTMLARTRGVYSATVDVKRGLTIVAYDPRQTAPQTLADVIDRLGYKATLPQPSGKSASDD